MSELVVVLGMHRSGTSLVTKSLEMMGFSLGDNLMPENDDNPKGFWEDIDIVTLNEKILNSCYSNWQYPALLFNNDYLEYSDEYLTEAKNLINRKIRKFKKLAIKDPRISILLPFWQRVFEISKIKVQYIFVYRNPLAIANSLAKRDKISKKNGLELWYIYSVNALLNLNKQKYNIVEYDNFLENPEKTINEINKKISKNKVNEELIKKFCNYFLDKDLCHHKYTISDLNKFDGINKGLIKLAEIIEKEQPIDLNKIKNNLSSFDNLWSEIRTNIYVGKIKFDSEQKKIEFIKYKEENKNKINEIEDNKEELNKLNALILKQQNEFDDKNNWIDSLKNEIKSKDDELTSQGNALVEKTKWVNTLLLNIEEKDNLFKKQEISFIEKEIWIENLKQDINDKDEVIGEIQAQIEDKNKWAKLLKNEIEKDAEIITGQNNVIEEKSDWIKALKKEISEKGNVLLKLNEALREKADWVDSLQKEINKNEIIIKEQHEEIENKNNNIHALSIDIKEGEKIVLKKQKELEEKDLWISSLKNEIRKNQNTLGERQGALEEKADWVKLLQLEIKEKEMQIKEYSHAYQGILTSLSFKLGSSLTYPLRMLKRKLNNFRLKRNEFRLESNEHKTKHSEIKFKEHKNPEVSVIIPVYNQFEYTLNCLNSIYKYLPKAKIEIIVIDDFSNDETEEVLKNISGIVYIKNESNLGFLLSCNKAVDYAKGEFVFLLNNDTTVKEGWIDQLINTFHNKKDAGLVGSKLVYPDGKLQEAGGIIWNDASGWNYGRCEAADAPEYSYLKEVDYVSGAAIMFPKQLFKDLGKFDETYVPAYYEDTDLAFKVRSAGKKVYMQPKSVIVHYEGVSNGQDVSQGIKKYQVTNKEKFFNKWKETLQLEHFPNAEKVFYSRDRSKDKLTVLVIDHYVPHFDQDAGSKSTYLYLKLMVKCGYNVKFIGDNFFRHEPYTTELESLGIEVLVGSYYQQNWKKWLSENADYIDIAYLHRPHISEKYIDYIKNLNANIKIIYFGHDLHFLRLNRQYKIEGGSKLLRESEAWKQREFKIFSSVDTVFYPSEVEVDEIIGENSEINVKAIPLYVLDVRESEIDYKDRHDLIFVGGFNHEPNIDAMVWFCSKVLPGLVNKIPELKLHIVGSKTPEIIRKLESTSIIIHGFLSNDELTELYAKVRLSVVPLRYGAGVKGKILEAMVAGVPVVTTSIGAEGIPNNATCMLISDDAIEMSDSIQKVYKNTKMAQSLISASYEMIKEYFSEDAVRIVLDNEFGPVKKNI